MDYGLRRNSYVKSGQYRKTPYSPDVSSFSHWALGLRASVRYCSALWRSLGLEQRGPIRNRRRNCGDAAGGHSGLHRLSFDRRGGNEANRHNTSSFGAWFTRDLWVESLVAVST